MPRRSVMADFLSVPPSAVLAVAAMLVLAAVFWRRSLGSRRAISDASSPAALSASFDETLRRTEIARAESAASRRSA